MRDDIVAAALLGAGFAALLGATWAWLQARRRVRVLEAQSQGPSSQDPRIEQLAIAVDTLAGQVEQIASGQEFLQRILAERTIRRQPLHDDSARITTPH